MSVPKVYEKYLTDKLTVENLQSVPEICAAYAMQTYCMDKTFPLTFSLVDFGEGDEVDFYNVRIMGDSPSEARFYLQSLFGLKHTLPPVDQPIDDPDEDVSPCLEEIRADVDKVVYVHGWYATDPRVLAALKKKFADVVALPFRIKLSSDAVQRLCMRPTCTDMIHLFPSEISALDIIDEKSPEITLPLIDEVLDSPAVGKISWRTLLGEYTSANATIDGCQMVRFTLQAASDGYRNLFLSVYSPFGEFQNRVTLRSTFGKMVEKAAKTQPAEPHNASADTPKPESEAKPNAPAAPQTKKKGPKDPVYIPDTNALLVHPEIIDKITDKGILQLPLMVLYELTKLKQDSKLSDKANAILGAITEKYREGKVNVRRAHYEKGIKKLPSHLQSKLDGDALVLAVALMLAQGNTPVTIITQDEGLQTRCMMLQNQIKVISAHDFVKNFK